jgi:DNA-binding NtrC family response regulator
VRIISATNKDLGQNIANGTFRHDLLYRLCVVPLHILKLSERGEDVPLLIDYFLEHHAHERGTQRKSITPDATKMLLSYDWPGNVRELENSLEYALTVGVDDQLGIDDFPPAVKNHLRPGPGKTLLQGMA